MRTNPLMKLLGNRPKLSSFESLRLVSNERELRLRVATRTFRSAFSSRRIWKNDSIFISNPRNSGFALESAAAFLSVSLSLDPGDQAAPFPELRGRYFEAPGSVLHAYGAAATADLFALTAGAAKEFHSSDGSLRTLFGERIRRILERDRCFPP